VRRILEVEIAKIAAKGRNEEDMKRIGAALERMDADIEGGGIGLDGDSDFHYALAQATHNQVLLKVVDLCTQLTYDARRDTLEIPNESSKALKEHRKISEAIAANDAKQASLLMQRHLARAVRTVTAGVKTATHRKKARS
jgi:GntR family transcriptional regulator, transcriptional repressor for pyruvate dehydrogenase complex